MAIEKLSAEAVQQALTTLPGWTLQGGKLHRECTFPDFVAAFGFLTQVAIASEKMDHHAEIFNVYNRVHLDLTTHDAGGLSARDIDLAQKINTFLGA
ncbi:MAG: 4a-hydroxytetrahydrobiopterin dehydratase [Oscillatoriales cyanobacterium SM2_1_8]|nr:4a-hydroxytetrahydrobiopterin dehydratase [Oscillatoriales cyanobacterium SM2_1_8]